MPFTGYHEIANAKKPRRHLEGEYAKTPKRHFIFKKSWRFGVFAL
jgi:hypothetical protein